MGSPYTEIYDYNAELDRLANRIKRTNRRYSSADFKNEDIVRHYFKVNPADFMDYYQSNPKSPVIDLFPDLKSDIDKIAAEDKFRQSYDKLGFFESAGAGIKTGLFETGKGLETALDKLMHGDKAGAVALEIDPTEGESFEDYANRIDIEDKRRQAERVKPIGEKWKKRIESWRDNNPRIKAHYEYKSQNPAGWNPFKWDVSDVGSFTGQGLTEIMSQAGVFALSRGKASLPYNYARIYGSELHEDFERLKELGYSDGEAMQIADANSLVSAAVQAIPETIVGNRVGRKILGIDAKPTLLGSTRDKFYKHILRAKKVKPQTPVAKFLTEDFFNNAITEGLTEWTQFLMSETINKYGYDESIGVWDRALGEEGAQNFWGGVFAGGAAGVSGNALSASLDALGKKYNFKPDKETAEEASGRIKEEETKADAPTEADAELANILNRLDRDYRARKQAEEETYLGIPITDAEKELAEAEKEKKSEKLTDQAIIAEMVLMDGERLDKKQRYRGNQLRKQARRDNISEAEMLNRALEQDPKALEQIDIDPKIASDFYTEQNIQLEDMPEVIQEAVQQFPEQETQPVQDQQEDLIYPEDVTQIEQFDPDQLEQEQFIPDQLVRDVTQVKEEGEKPKKKSPSKIRRLAERMINWIAADKKYKKIKQEDLSEEARLHYEEEMGEIVDELTYDNWTDVNLDLANDLDNFNKELKKKYGKSHTQLKDSELSPEELKERQFFANLHEAKKFWGRLIKPKKKPKAKKPLREIIVHSGGADGADTEFQIAAEESGYTVRAHSFEGHAKKNPARVGHDSGELSIADKHLEKANKTLKRRFPPSSPFSANLLRRNYFQVIDSEQVIAVSRISNGQVVGGTAWATQMGIDMGKPVYVFDMKTNKWHKWDGKKYSESEVPKITGSFAGIGARKLTPRGRQEIRKLFGIKEKPTEKAKPKKKASAKLTVRGIATEVTKLSEKTRSKIIELMREREYVGLDHPERDNDITQLLSGEFGGDFEQGDATEEELAVHKELSKVFPDKELRERVLKYIDDNIPNKIWTADFLEGMAKDRLLKYIGPEAVAAVRRSKMKARKKPPAKAEQPKAKEALVEVEKIEEIRASALKSQKSGALNVTLIGSTAKKGKGKDVDVLYEFPEMDFGDFEKSGLSPKEFYEERFEDSYFEGELPSVDDRFDSIVKIKDTTSGDTQLFQMSPAHPEKLWNYIGTTKSNRIYQNIQKAPKIDLLAKEASAEVAPVKKTWDPVSDLYAKPVVSKLGVKHIERIKGKDLTSFTESIRNIIKNTKGTTTRKGHKAVWFGERDYIYTGSTHKAKEMPKLVTQIKEKIEEALELDKGYYNSVLINELPAGVGIPAHSDAEDILRLEDKTIGSVGVLSLGGTSVIDIINPRTREKLESHRIAEGDIYELPAGDFQNTYLHAVGESAKPRISFTFRKTRPIKEVPAEVGVLTSKIKKKKLTPRMKEWSRKFEKLWGLSNEARPVQGDIIYFDGKEWVINKVSDAGDKIIEKFREDPLSALEEGISGVEEFISEKEMDDVSLYQLFELMEMDVDQPEVLFDIPIWDLVDKGFDKVGYYDSKTKKEVRTKKLIKPAEVKPGKTLPLFQRPRKGVKALDNKKLARAMEKRLKKQFPWVKAKWVDEIYDEEGSEVAGRALTDAVEWSKGKATLDTIPHEYAHIYVRLMKDSPVIKEGIKRFKTEEKLVQYIGEYYTGKMKNKGLISRIRTWLRKFVLALKKFFKGALTDKDVADIASEMFFNAEIADIPANLPIQIDYQEILSIDEQTLFKAFDNAWEYSKKASEDRLPAHIWINAIKKFIGRNKDMVKVFERWIDDREENDIINWKKFNPSIQTDVVFEDANVVESIVNDTYIEILDPSIGTGVYNIDTRRSGNRLKYIPMYALKVVISTQNMRKLFDTAKMNTAGFDHWLDNVQPKLTGVVSAAISTYEKQLMLRFYLLARQQINVHRPKGSLPNDRNYMQIFKRYPDQWGGKISFKYRIIDSSVGKFSKSGNEFGVARSSKELPFVAENIMDLKDLIWLSSKEYYAGKEKVVTYPSGKQFTAGYRWSYNFLNENELHQMSQDVINFDSGSHNKLVPVFIRGDSMRIAFAYTKDSHMEKAGDISYWEEQEKDGFITKKQLKWQRGQMGKNKEFLAQEIAVFEIMNRIMPGYATFKDSPKIIMRFKIPITPVIRLEGAPDEVVMFINPETTKIKLGLNDAFDMMVDVPGVGIKNRFDGATFKSKAAFNSLVKFGGLDISASTAKTVGYEISGNTTLSAEEKLISAIFGEKFIGGDVYAQKHLEFLADRGMQWFDEDGNMIAEVRDDGDIYTADGEYVSYIQTPDEAKIRTGKYDVFNTPIRVSGDSLGIIQYSDQVHTKGKMLRQQFNFIRDRKYKEAILKNMINSGLMHKVLTNAVQSLQSAEGIKTLVTNINKSFPDNLSASYINIAKIGGGRHPAIIKALTGIPSSDRAKYSGLVVSKMIDPAINFDGLPGTILSFKPDTSGQLELFDAAIPFKNAKFLRSRFLKENKGENYNFKNVRKWVRDTKPEINVGRTPIPHKNGVSMLSIVDIDSHRRKNEVRLNPILVYLYKEADNDGDHLHIVDIQDNMKVATREYFTGEEYTKDVHGINIADYVDEVEYNLLDRVDRNKIYEALAFHAQAEVSKIQAIYGILQDTFESIDINEIGKLSIRSGDKIITVPEMKNEKHTVDNMLRIYLQAAVDNGKHLLLSQWNYSRGNLIAKLFEFGNGKGLDEYESDIKEVALSVIYKSIWTHANETYAINNTLDTTGKFNLTQLVDKSIALKESIDARIENWALALNIDSSDGDIINITYKDDALNLNESTAVKIGEIFKNEDMRKQNIAEYHNHIYLDAHRTALEYVKENIGYEHNFPSSNYANGLVNMLKDYFKVVDIKDQGKRKKPLSGRPAFPDVWDTSEHLVGMIEVKANQFANLSEKHKILATIDFLEKYGRLVNDDDGISRLDLFPLPVDKTRHTVLDQDVAGIYFKQFDKALDEDYMNKDSKEIRCP